MVRLMEKITILEKSYIVHKHSSAKSLKYILDKEFQDLDVEITDISFSKKRHAEITLEGDDKVIAKNFLIANFGTIRSIADIEIGDTIYGRFRDVGGVKFGIFVDAGIQSSTRDIDALYPLFELRNQLSKGNKNPLVSIIRAYGIVENLPMHFEITKKQAIGSKVWVKLTEESLNWLNEPLIKKREALIICGTTRRTIKQALIESRHAEDIEEIERVGLLEYRLTCKRGTRADGLIPEIGYFFGRAKIGAQVLKRVDDLLKQ